MIDPDQIDDILTLAELRQHLRVDTSDENTTLEDIQFAAFQWVEDYTGQLITEQTVTESFSGFRDIVLDAWPITSVTSVSYVGSDGATVAMDPAEFRLIADARPASIARATAGSPSAAAWPVTMAGIDDAVKVTVQAGYGTRDTIPAPLVMAAKVIAASLYEDRSGPDEKAATAASNLLRFKYRRWAA